MGKVRDKFKILKQKKQTAFIPYFTFAYPTLEIFERIILMVSKLDVDFIEIGLPFSDPIADGPTIEEASAIALE